MSITPASVATSQHVVSPSKLFAIAETRFNAAMRVIGEGGSSLAPNSVATSIALREAESGVRTLRSVIVPSTPWGQREIAAMAMASAHRAIDSLEQYSSAMASRGEGPFQRHELSVGTLLLLDGARAALQRAAVTLPA